MSSSADASGSASPPPLSGEALQALFLGVNSEAGEKMNAEEAGKFSAALKKPNFQKLFTAYMEELTAPAVRAELGRMILIRAEGEASQGKVQPAGIKPPVKTSLQRAGVLRTKEAGRTHAVGAARLQCHACSAAVPAALAFHCKECQQAVYCSAPCQWAHWRSTHKVACKRLRVLLPRPRLPLRVWDPLPVQRVTQEEGLLALEAQRAAAFPGTVFTPSTPAEESAALQALQRTLAGDSHCSLPFLASALGLSGAARCTLLALAACQGCAGLVGLLLATGSDPCHCALGLPGPPVLTAVRCASSHTLQLLLEAGADPNQVWQGSYTPALVACCQLYGSGGGQEQDWQLLRCAELLLQAGAELEAADGAGLTPLLHCCWRGDATLPLARLLLGAGADPEGFTPPPTPMRCLDASLCGQGGGVSLGMLRELLAAGASVALRQAHLRPPVESYHTPVSYLCCAEEGQQHVQAALQALLTAGASPCTVLLQPTDPMPNCPLPTPLLLAIVRRAPTAVVQALLDAGAHPDAPALGKEFDTPMLNEMQAGGSAQTIAVLLSAGATAQVPPCLAAKRCSGEGLRLLLQHGMNLATTCNIKPFSHALHRGCRSVLLALLEAGACAEEETGCLAVLVGGKELEAGVVRLVLAHRGTRGVARAELQSPRLHLLHRAASKGHGAGVMELLAAGERADQKNDFGELALPHLLAAAGKGRNRGEGRRRQYARAVKVLTAATGMAAGKEAAARDGDSDGELCGELYED